MGWRSHHRLAAAAMFLALGSVPILAAEQAPAAPAKEPGDNWEVTTQMSMKGMSMPARKHTVCSPKEWKEAPGSTDERQKCTNSDFKLEGQKASWKVTCAGPPAMSGEGEITRASPDAYSGTIKFTSKEGEMTLNLSGRRLGDCEVAQK